MPSCALLPNNSARLPESPLFMLMRLCFNKLDELVYIRTGAIDIPDALFLEPVVIFIRNYTAQDHYDMVHLVLLQPFHHLGQMRFVSAGEEAHAYNVNVFLNS